MSKQESNMPDKNDFPARFSRKSLIVLGIALLTIITGFILMSNEEIVVSPILLVIGYIILIPVGLLKK